MQHFSLQKAMLFCVLLCTSLLLKAQSADIYSGTLSYECLGANQYQVSLEIYVDCNTGTLPDTLDINWASNCMGGIGGVVSATKAPSTPIDMGNMLPNNDTCNGGTVNQCLWLYYYKAELNVPSSCSDFELGWLQCCRSDSLQTVLNASTTPYYTYTKLIQGTTFCNNSPVFANLGVLGICANYGWSQSYSLGVFDPDGDSLAFSLATGWQGGNTPVNYSIGYSPTNPITTTNGLTIDPNTGVLTCNISAVENGEITVLVKEYRNGVQIGEVSRTIYITSQLCFINTPPTLTGIDSTNVFDTIVIAGQQICFDIHAEDIDTVHHLIMNWDSAIAGSTFVITGGSRPVGTFCWTPTLADLGYHSFLVNANDFSCPVPGVVYEQYTINVVAPLGVETTKNSNHMQVMPNPAKAYVQLKWTNIDALPERLSMVDVQGKVILNKSISTNIMQLNIQELSSGIYTIITFDENGRIQEQQRLLVE